MLLLFWKSAGVVVSAPVAFDGTLAASGSTTGTLVATDPNLLSLLYCVVDASLAHGTVDITNVLTGAYTYTPTSGYSGAASFTFMVTEKATGSGGAVTTPGISNLLIQPDGKIVVSDGQFPISHARRFLSTGLLDTSFGTGGTSDALALVALAIALQADGKIVVLTGAVPALLLQRLNANGTLDTGFGTAGTVTTPGGRSGLSSNTVAVKMQGTNILVGGQNAALTHPWMARYDSTGVLDPTFGTAGEKTFTDAALANDTVSSFGFQSDGKIIVGMGALTASGSKVLRLAASDGAIDATFGTAGVFSSAYDSSTVQVDLVVAVGPDDKITFPIPVNYTSLVIQRLTAAGVLDSTFGTSGTATFAWALNPVAYSVAIQPDLKTLVAAMSDPTNTSAWQADPFRLLVDGTLDPSYGTAGFGTTYTGDGYTFPYSSALASNGCFVLGGSANTDAFIIRYYADGTLDTSFGAGGGGLDSNIATITITVTSVDFPPIIFDYLNFVFTQADYVNIVETPADNMNFIKTVTDTVEFF